MKRKVISIFIMLLCGILCTGCQNRNSCSPMIFEKLETRIFSVGEKNAEKLSLMQEKSKEILLLACEGRKEDPRFQKVKKIVVPTEEEIKTYLNMTIEEIEKITGTTINSHNGTLMIFSFAAFFPCLYLENSSIYFVCFDYDKTEKPIYLSFYGEYYEEYLSTIGLSCDMGFKEIEQIWGEGELMVNQRGDTDDYRYMLSYERSGLRYNFVSSDKEGYYFDLYLDLAPKQ